MNHRRTYLAGLLFVVTTLLFLAEGATPAYAVSSDPNFPTHTRDASVAPREESQAFEHQLFAPALSSQNEADTMVWSSIDNGPVELCWDSYDAGQDVTGFEPDNGTLTVGAGVVNVTVDGEPRTAFCTDFDNLIDADCFSNTAVAPMDPLVACSIQHYPPVLGLTDADAAARQSMVWYFTDEFALESPSDVKALYDEYITFVEAEFAAGRCDAQLVDDLALTIDPTSAANLLVSDGDGGFLDSPHDYTIELKKGELPIANNVVTFTTDLGTLSWGVQTGATVVATTDANGEATVTITYDNTGEATITASTVVSLATGVTLDAGAEVQDIGMTDFDQYPLEVTATKSWEITPNPAIEIKKYTNGFDADEPFNAGSNIVPTITPGGDVVWTYVVSNTGNIPFPAASVDVTDNRGVEVTFVEELVGSDPSVLSPGEIWLYSAEGDALTLSEEEGAHIVAGCLTSQEFSRPTYNNVGTVTVTQYELTDSDPSHYCNPEEPGIEIKKYTNGADADDPNGADVPKISPTGDIIWTYVVSNTGNIPFLADSVDVTDNRGVVVTFADYLVGDEDGFLEPGEIWLYTGSGDALTLAEEEGEHIVAGCLNSEEVSRPTYNNVGTVTVTQYELTDNDPSHYCNPEGPAIEIKKYTNGFDADEPFNSDSNIVPTVTPGGDVVWTYVVSNTGNIAFPADSVDVTDNRGVVVTFVEELVGSDPSVLSPGEIWLYSAEGDALTLSEEEGAHIVAGCLTSQEFSRPTYNNVGTVTVTQHELTDSDPSHYCNPEEPGIEIKKYTNGADADDPNGADVPKISPTGDIVWTYVVSNTGNIPFLADSVDVTDNRGVAVTFVEELVGTDPSVLSPGEIWLYTGSGDALTLAEEEGEHIVAGCLTSEEVSRPTYNNVGMVTVTQYELTDSDPSHYCNPEEPELAALGNRVWIDEDEDGAQDEGEPDVPGVTVTLFNCADEQVGEPLVTDENGEYFFDNLVPGCYYVVFDPETLPDEFSFTTPHAEGVDDTLDSDADPEDGSTPTVTLEGGDVNLDLDAGILPDAPPPTNLPGGPQPNQQSTLFLPSLGN